MEMSGRLHVSGTLPPGYRTHDAYTSLLKVATRKIFVPVRNRNLAVQSMASQTMFRCSLLVSLVIRGLHFISTYCSDRPDSGSKICYYFTGS